MKSPRKRRGEIPARSTLRKYRLTPDRYADLVAAQGGGCAICGTPEDLCVDHDHECCDNPAWTCGECVRGILCRTCNARLAYMEKNDNLQRAMDYLAKYHPDRKYVYMSGGVAA